MRLLIDALAATEYSGGMRLHALEVIRGWAEEFPEDELIVVSGKQLQRDLGDLSNVTFYTWPSESIVMRAPGQIFATPALRAIRQADYCISLSPIVSPLVGRRRSVCFQHDWRHIKRPDEFSRAQRAYRYLWQVSARRAGLNVCISEKTQVETREVAPTAKTLVIENGRDHPRRWNVPTIPRKEDASNRRIVTFGHHNNKRPELVINAFSTLPESARAGTTLVVLGARGTYGAELRQLAEDAGVSESVELPGFVSDDDYHGYISGASCIVLASTDEGFGLPLAEAEYFGIPSVITSDSGVESVFEHALVADPTASALADSLDQALKQGVRAHAASEAWSWKDTARTLRTFLSA